MKFKLMGICTMAFYLTQASAYSDPQKEYMLCDSMLKHDLVAASELLDQGADPNTTCSEAGRNLFSPLYLSMVDSSGAGEKLSLKMISKNASASSINTFRGSWGRRTVISNFDEACRFSYPALKAFLDKGVDPLTVDQPGVSPLFALLNGGLKSFQKREMADVFFSKGYSPYDPKADFLSFFVSSDAPAKEIEARLDSWDFSKDTKNATNRLMPAIRSSQSLSVIKKLVEKGADIYNIQTGYQNLLAAYLYWLKPNTPDKFQTIEWLVHAGIEVTANDDTALATAVIQKLDFGIVKFLLDLGAKHLTENFYILMERTDEEAFFIADLFLKNGADIESVTHYDQYDEDTALISAIRKENLSMVKYLVKKGAQVNHESASGSPLCHAKFIASQSHDKKIVNFLKANGALLGTCKLR